MGEVKAAGGTQRVWLHLPICFTLHLISDVRLTACEMLSAPGRAARPKMNTDTGDSVSPLGSP